MNTVGWRDYSADTSFPFVDGASISVPIVDARIVSDSHPFLSQVIVAGSEVTLYFSNQAGTKISSGKISFLDETDVVDLEFLSGGHAGTVVVDRSRDSEWFNSEFEWEDAAMAPACFALSTLPKLGAFITGLTRNSGRVALIEGLGIRFVVSGERIRIDSIADTSEREGCCAQIGGPLKMINGATPDDYGNVNLILQPYLEPDLHSDQIQILRMTPGQNGITFSIAK